MKENCFVCKKHLNEKKVSRFFKDKRFEICDNIDCIKKLDQVINEIVNKVLYEDC